MSLPPGITTCTLTAGSSLSMFGDPVTVSAVVTPVYGGSIRRIVWETTGQSFPDFPKTFTSDSGELSVRVPHVDQPGFLSPSGQPFTGWKYQVDVTLTQGGQTRTYTQDVQPLVGRTFIDLDNPTSGAGGGGTGLTVTDNGDGTFTLAGSSVTDNADGTWTAEDAGLVYVIDGSFTATA